MNEIFYSALKSASGQVLTQTQQYYGTEDIVKKSIELDPIQVFDLSKKILALPDDDISLLLLYYSFGLAFEDISSLLQLGNVKDKLKYADHLLATGIGLSKSEMIDNFSMRDACNSALDAYAKDEDLDVVPTYSRNFVREMQKLKLIRTHANIYINVLQKVAVIFLVIVISIGIAFGVNAQFRESVYRWFRDTFQQFTEFMLTTNETSRSEPSFQELLMHRPIFIPDGYTLESIKELFPSVYFDFINTEGEMLTIIGHLPNEAIVALNTEGAEVERVLFREEYAYYWTLDCISYFVFILDGYHFNIVGRLDREKIVKIAENIKIP